jgi:L-ascorbate metabolism protein UlaG (beta-lactamase superfamily)
MRLRFLGTGAADWNIAGRRPGMEWRRFSSTLIDDSLMADPGPHIYDYAETNNLPQLFDKVTDVIVTHSHPDHFNVKSLLRLCGSGRNCRVYGDSACLRKLKSELGEDMSVDFRCVTPGGHFMAGGYDIMPVKANHGTGDINEIALNYVISKGGKTMYYGLDTGWLPYETWLIIRKLKFDCMVLELTMGDIVPGDDRIFSHTSIPMLKIMLETFRKQGCAPDGCKIIVSHLARTLHTDHASTAAALSPLGVDVAYDGLLYEF